MIYRIVGDRVALAQRDPDRPALEARAVADKLLDEIMRTNPTHELKAEWQRRRALKRRIAARVAWQAEADPQHDAKGT